MRSLNRYYKFSRIQRARPDISILVLAGTGNHQIQSRVPSLVKLISIIAYTQWIQGGYNRQPVRNIRNHTNYFGTADSTKLVLLELIPNR